MSVLCRVFCAVPIFVAVSFAAPGGTTPVSFFNSAPCASDAAGQVCANLNIFGGGPEDIYGPYMTESCCAFNVEVDGKGNFVVDSKAIRYADRTLAMRFTAPASENALPPTIVSAGYVFNISSSTGLSPGVDLRSMQFDVPQMLPLKITFWIGNGSGSADNTRYELIFDPKVGADVPTITRTSPSTWVIDGSSGIVARLQSKPVQGGKSVTDRGLWRMVFRFTIQQ